MTGRRLEGRGEGQSVWVSSGKWVGHMHHEATPTIYYIGAEIMQLQSEIGRLNNPCSPKQVTSYNIMYVRTCMHTHTHTYMHVCMYVCMYVCMVKSVGNILQSMIINSHVY